MRLRAVLAVAAVLAAAALVAVGALGVSGGDTIRTLAGSNDPLAAAKSQFRSFRMAVDGQGAVYFFDGRYYLHKLSACGTETKTGGDAKANSPDLGDGGPATSADLWFSAGIAADRQGNVYIAQHGEMVVRKISTSGTITTIAGRGLEQSLGDGGPASAAALGGPVDLAADDHGNVFIS